MSVDGMIVAASTTLLADSRNGHRGGSLPWLLLAVGSVASLAANVAVAEPTMTGRVIAAWPSFALIGSYELLMRQIRATATAPPVRGRQAQSSRYPVANSRPAPGSTAGGMAAWRNAPADGRGLRQEALRWAIANRGADGRLPSGRAIADQFGRRERWGRLVKQHGEVGTRRSAAQFRERRDDGQSASSSANARAEERATRRAS
jgi:hypothetical protein